MTLTIGKIVLLAAIVLAAIVATAFRAQLRAAWLATQKFFREVRIEMQKVAWPTQNDIIALTAVVLVGVIAMTIVITAWDQVLAWALQAILPGQGA